MNLIYIFGITTLFSAGTVALVEDLKTTKISQQRILLRKLQNYQATDEGKPFTWNEILADVLVNKIRIFSFRNQNTEDVEAPKEKSKLTNFLGEVLVVYKKFVYDAFVVTSNDINLSINTTGIDIKKVEFEERILESDEIISPTLPLAEDGPKGDVELVEPRYHGKITVDDETKTETTSTAKHDNLGHKEAAIESQEMCPNGAMKNKNGDCVNDNSRFILAIPFQCPYGYRRDALGRCRRSFNFRR